MPAKDRTTVTTKLTPAEAEQFRALAQQAGFEGAAGLLRHLIREHLEAHATNQPAATWPWED